MKDPNKAKTERMMVKRTLKNLELNRMTACYVETKEDALKLVKQIIPEGVKTASGGSQTLVQCGLIDFLKEHTKYFDRYDKTLSPEGRQSISTAMTKRFHPKAGSRMKGRHISPTSTSHLPTH